MGCLACGRVFHDECCDIVDSVCCCQRKARAGRTASTGSGDASSEVATRGRPKKNDALLEDPHSTWRKRATVEFPLNREAFCEWRLLANCGGGKYPIVGCASGKQSALHHGPVKITDGVVGPDGQPYNFNDRSNIHLLCGRCHVLWHHWNDTPFDPLGYQALPHEPREATPHEILTWTNSRTRPTAPEPKIGSFTKD